MPARRAVTETATSNSSTVKPEENDFSSDNFNHFVNSLSIKELLIYNHEEIYFKFVGTTNQLNLIKQEYII